MLPRPQSSFPPLSGLIEIDPLPPPVGGSFVFNATLLSQIPLVPFSCTMLAFLDFEASSLGKQAIRSP